MISRDVIETKAKFALFSAAEWQKKQNAAAAVAADATTAVVPVVDAGPVLTDAELMNTLLRWNDSNHECLLFSNVSHVVYFLSLDPDLMKRRMYV